MSDCNHTAAESCLRGDECAQCLRDAASSFVPAPGSTHLALAQKCFTEWLQELDGLLHDSELAYDEYAGNILSGDMEAASKSMHRATQSLRLGRLMIKAGLDAGV